MKTEKNRIILLFSLFVLLLGIVLLGLRFAPALANEETPDQYDRVKTNELTRINNGTTETEKQPLAEIKSDEQTFEASTSTPDSATLLMTMVQDFENNIFTHEGWLHYVYYQESEVNNGVALPQNYYVDVWYQVNEAGFVSQEVGSFYDDAGNLNQRGIFTDNTFINLSTKEEMETEGPYKLKLDLGVTKSMLEMHKEGAILTQEVVTVDGKPMIKFSVISNYDKPINISNSSQPVKNVRMTALFDQATGVISEMESVFILIDGTEELFYRDQILTLEWDDLPEEFFQLLEDN